MREIRDVVIGVDQRMIRSVLTGTCPVSYCEAVDGLRTPMMRIIPRAMHLVFPRDARGNRTDR